MRRLGQFARRHKIITSIFGLFWVLVIVAAATGGSSTKKNSSSTAVATKPPSPHHRHRARAATSRTKSSTSAAPESSSTTTTSTTTVPESTQEALNYVKSFGSYMATVDVDVLKEEEALLRFRKNETPTTLERLTIAAQKAHDEIDSIRKQFFLGDEVGNNSEIGNAEDNIAEGANDIKNAEGQLVVSTDNPSSNGAAAQFLLKFETATKEWDHGVRVVYRLAYGNAKDAPTL